MIRTEVRRLEADVLISSFLKTSQRVWEHLDDYTLCHSAFTSFLYETSVVQWNLAFRVFGLTGRLLTMCTVDAGIRQRWKTSDPKQPLPALDNRICSPFYYVVLENKEKLLAFI